MLQRHLLGSQTSKWTETTSRLEEELTTIISTSKKSATLTSNSELAVLVGGAWGMVVLRKGMQIFFSREYTKRVVTRQVDYGSNYCGRHPSSPLREGFVSNTGYGNYSLYSVHAAV